MSGFGTVQLSSTTLTTGQMPVPSVAVPNEAGGNLTALEGGPESTDTNGNKTAPASMYVKDGGDVTEGAKADTAITDSTTTNSKMSFLKGLVKMLASVWDSTHGRLIVDGSQVTQPVSGTVTAIPTYPLPTGSASFIFKEVKNVAVTAGTPVPIWAPAAGKKFRLIGANLYPTGTSTSGIFLEDGSGSEFLRFPRLNSANTAPTPLNFWPNGYLSTTANNGLFIDVSVSCEVEGFVWGDEE